LFELASLIRSTRRQTGSHQRLRADAGELNWLDQIHRSSNVERIQFLRARNESGARTADMRITLSGGRLFDTEVTTVTRAGRSNQNRFSRHQIHIVPTRPLSGTALFNKFMAKIRRGQVGDDGVIAVRINGVVQQPPALLSSDQVTRLTRELTRRGAAELWLRFRDGAQNGAWRTVLVAAKPNSGIYQSVFQTVERLVP
jgi:hypothetical protein